MDPTASQALDDPPPSITLNLRGLPFRIALHQVLRQASAQPLEYGMSAGVVLISREGGEAPITRIYDVAHPIEQWIAEHRFHADWGAETGSDLSRLHQADLPESLTTGAVEALEQMLYDQIDTPSWKQAGGTIGQIREFPGVLVITQSPENHLQIESLFAQLGAAQGRRR